MSVTRSKLNSDWAKLAHVEVAQLALLHEVSPLLQDFAHVAGTCVSDWLGPKRNVFCVDFSIGRRFRERELRLVEGSCAKLGALRWPERELVFDTGEVLVTG